MSPFDFKKRQCRSVEFKGQGPYNKDKEGMTFIYILRGIRPRFVSQSSSDFNHTISCH